MSNISFYSDRNIGLENSGFNAGSLASDERDLIVNCAGRMDSPYPINTYNKIGRLDYYLMFVESGRLKVELTDNAVTAEENDVIVFCPKYKYKYSSVDGKCEYLWVHFTGRTAGELLRLIGFSGDASIKRINKENKVPIYFKKIFDSYLKDSKYRDLELSTFMSQLILEVAKSEESEGTREGNRLQASVSYIRHNYKKNINTAVLAKIEHISPSRYNYLFKKLMGIPPNRYVLQCRLNAACDLFLSTDLTIKEVGLSVGYEDSHFFSRIFKKYVGVSPSEYKKKYFGAE